MTLTGRTVMAPFYEGICQGHGPGAVEGAAALVGVNVVRPAGVLAHFAGSGANSVIGVIRVEG